MPLKNTLGSFKSLSTSEGYVVPDNYWLLNWEYENTGNYFGSTTGSYFTTTGKIWLGERNGSVLEVVAVDDYGRFNYAQTITLPTLYTINANAYIDYTYNGLADITIISGLDDTPVSITKGTQIANTFTSFPVPRWTTVTQDIIYVQRSDGTGTVLPHGNTLNNDWVPENFSAYANGYVFSAHSDYIVNGVDYSDVFFNYDTNGNLRYVDTFDYAGSQVVTQTEVEDLIPFDDNSAFSLIYLHGTVTTTPFVPYSYGLVCSFLTTGYLNYSKKLTIGANALILTEAVIIGDYYYAIGSSNGNYYVVKGLVSTGVVSLAKQITGVTSLNSIQTGKLSPADIYITCNNTLCLVKFDESLNLIYQRELSLDFQLQVDGVGSMYFVGDNFVLKTPSDGTILQSGTYTLNDIEVTYSSISSISTANATVTSTAFTDLVVNRNTTFASVYARPNTIIGSEVDVQKTSWNS